MIKDINNKYLSYDDEIIYYCDELKEYFTESELDNNYIYSEELGGYILHEDSKDFYMDDELSDIEVYDMVIVSG